MSHAETKQLVHEAMKYRAEDKCTGESIQVTITSEKVSHAETKQLVQEAEKYRAEECDAAVASLFSVIDTDRDHVVIRREWFETLLTIGTDKDPYVMSLMLVALEKQFKVVSVKNKFMQEKFEHPPDLHINIAFNGDGEWEVEVNSLWKDFFRIKRRSTNSMRYPGQRAQLTSCRECSTNPCCRSRSAGTAASRCLGAR
jgi:hypothetical protein